MIYGQLKELQAFKDEILNDLDDFMSEVESSQLVTIPQQQLADVVDIVADEERSKADNLVNAYMKGDQQQISETQQEMDHELNPFWAKFLQPEKHYAVSATEIAPTIEKALNQLEESKVNKIDRRAQEMQKIRALETQLAELNKKQREMKRLAQQAVTVETVEEETKSARKPRPPSGNRKGSAAKPLSSAKPRKKETTEDKGDTFLTDMLFKGRPASKPNLRKTPANKRQQDTESLTAQSEDDPEEYRDMVFDFDESKALVKVADDFLRGETPLAITQGEDERFENQSQSEAGKSTAKSKGKFIDANIRSAGSYNAYLRQKQVDRLDPVAKAKLERMLQDIDENLDDLQKEKEQYQKQLGSAMSNNKSGWQSHAPSVISKFSSDSNFYTE